MLSSSCERRQEGRKWVDERREILTVKLANDEDDVNDKCCFCLDFGVIMCCHSMFDLLPLAYPH